MDDRRYLTVTHYNDYLWHVHSYPWGDRIAETADRNEAFRVALKHAAQYVGFAECHRVLKAWELAVGALEAPELADA